MEFSSVHQSQVSLVELILQETGTFDSQYIRPYTAEISSDGLSRLTNRVNNYSSNIPNATIGSELIAGLCSGIVAPATEIEAPVGIINGWNERRFRFLLTVEEKNAFGSVVHHFQGYSEYFAISHGDLIDPNMNFFINSYVTISRVQDKHTPGLFSDAVIKSKILTDGRLVDTENTGLYTMRHPDLFAGLAKSYVNQAFPSSQYTDIRLSNQGNAVIPIDRVDCGIPSHYLSNTIDIHRNAQMTAQSGFDESSLFDRAFSMAHERDALENRFIRDLTNNFAPGSIFPKIDFTINNLITLDPTFASRIHYTPVDDPGALSQSNCFASWADRSIETRVASILGTAIPALMLDCGLVTVNFTSTNMTINGEVNTRMLSPGTTINSFNQIGFYNLFIGRYNREIHPDITQMNQIPISVSVAGDIKNELQVVVSVAGGPLYEYRYPCFCDGLMQPVLSRSEANFNAMVAGVDEIINHTGIADRSLLSNTIYSV